MVFDGLGGEIVDCEVAMRGGSVEPAKYQYTLNSCENDGNSDSNVD
jgi:hypothetical protein